MKDKEKYFNMIEKDIVNNIYEESLMKNESYIDKFMKIVKGYNFNNSDINFIERCVMANDAESLINLILHNKIIKFNDKLYNVIDNEINKELSSKLSLDIIRILINNKFVEYATLIMTSSLYYKVHFIDDLFFLEERLMNLYLFGKKKFPSYFENQFNDFELEKDKDNILGLLINYYGAILDEVPKYYHSYLFDNKVILEYPSDITKRDKKVEFNFIDLDKLNTTSDKLNTLKRLEKRIKDMIKGDK